ncbi:acyl-CoA synthetase (plasmid) [Alteromonas sp. I4]|nr:acyl-CoA synthetase [Alteromonas sp. I4]
MHPSIYAKQNPNKPAFIMAKTQEVVTYRQLDERSNRAAHLFRSLGLHVGDHISILLENSAQFFEVVWAAQRSGLVYTAISTHLKPDEIAYIVDNSDAKALITSDKYLEMVQQAEKNTPNLRSTIVIGSSRGNFVNYFDSTASLPDTPVSDQCAGTDMLYSSGTTGCPKGVTVSLSGEGIETIPAVMTGMMQYYGLGEDTVYLSPAPLYHAAPLRFNMLTMFAGGTCVIMTKFDEVEALELMEKYKVTHAQWVPVMFTRMLKVQNKETYDLSSLRVAIHSAAPCPPDVKLQMIEWWGPILDEFYSCTEGVGLTSINSEEWLSHPQSVGKAKVGTIHILDDDGNAVRPGVVGNIYFSDGPEFSYHKDPEKTLSARNEVGWFSVGDMGYVDEEGYLYLTDRKSFMIISGGVNVYPQEVENLLVTHPKVFDVAVVGVPNSDLGEEVKAVVQLVPEATPTEQLATEIIEFCKARLSHIKCPKSIDFDPQLPRYPNGKLYKKKIRDVYWAV